MYKYIVTKRFIDGHLKGLLYTDATSVKYKIGSIIKTVEGTKVEIVNIEKL